MNGRPTVHFTDPVQLQEMLDAYDQGKSSVELAILYGCTPWTIRYRLKKVGRHTRSPAEAAHLKYPDPKTKSRVRRAREAIAAIPPDPEQRCQGKTYAEYIAAAVNRGDRTIQAVTGKQPKVKLV